MSAYKKEAPPCSTFVPNRSTSPPRPPCPRTQSTAIRQALLVQALRERIQVSDGLDVAKLPRGVVAALLEPFRLSASAGIQIERNTCLA